jgi:hypothetical protein
MKHPDLFSPVPETTPVIPVTEESAVIIAIVVMDGVDIMTSGNLSPEVIKIALSPNRRGIFKSHYEKDVRSLLTR